MGIDGRTDTQTEKHDKAHTAFSKFYELAPKRQKYRMIQKDGLNFIHLYFLSYTWYVNDLHYI